MPTAVVMEVGSGNVMTSVEETAQSSSEMTSVMATPNTLWWTARPTMFHQHNLFNFNPTDDDPQDEGSPPPAELPSSSSAEREPMFEKPLTPSDVGKLNRLVIPKQHAEKHFPLVGEATQLLSFEDESGKWWRFRYSYWSSSQSYVLTKGWSRFVKDKRLDAGDVVLFHRHRADSDRLFIGWRRRGEPSPGGPAVAAEMGGGGGGGGAMPCGVLILGTVMGRPNLAPILIIKREAHPRRRGTIRGG
ncbi:hypothetical protein NL676_016595 [Syzygium grande]|nr:hypothetical protein NL676_016595 [Syzygium grande]